MTLEEFRRAVARYERRQIIVMLPLFGALVAGLAYAPFFSRFQQYLEARFGESVPQELGSVPFFGVMILAWIAILPLYRRLERRYRVACPHCGVNVATAKGIVIASRNCPHCGKRVLELATDA
jgi:uncharacterized BrkB/YihY/UPF0761 family membrane protein